MRRSFSRGLAFLIFTVVVTLLLVADRITKILAVDILGDGRAVPFIPGLLDFYLVYNEGAAFGMLEGARPYFLIVAAVASACIIGYIALTKRHFLLRIVSLSLICAGAVGNAIDRAASGRVVDFIHTLFIEFPLFNVADSAITVGVILMLLSILLDYYREAKGRNDQPLI
jgi:signal peptidase II